MWNRVSRCRRALTSIYFHLIPNNLSAWLLIRLSGKSHASSTLAIRSCSILGTCKAHTRTTMDSGFWRIGTNGIDLTACYRKGFKTKSLKDEFNQYSRDKCGTRQIPKSVSPRTYEYVGLSLRVWRRVECTDSTKAPTTPMRLLLTLPQSVYRKAAGDN